MFSYNGEQFVAYFTPVGGKVIVTTFIGKERVQAFSKRTGVRCMSDLQGMAACLLAEKKDIWFLRDNYCTEEEFNKGITPEMIEEEKLEKLINNVCDITYKNRESEQGAGTGKQH